MTDRVIKIGDDDIAIKRIKVKDLSNVMRAFAPFVDEFERIVKAKNTMPYSELVLLVSTYTDEAVFLASELTDKPPEFFRELDPLQFFNVMQQAVAYSGDFFLHQIFMPLSTVGGQINTLITTASYVLSNSDTNQTT